MEVAGVLRRQTIAARPFLGKQCCKRIMIKRYFFFGFASGVLVILTVLGVAKYAQLSRQPAVPKASIKLAEVVGLPPGIRSMVQTEEMTELEKEGLDSVQKERAFHAQQGQGNSLPPSNYLALSGGADRGAFTAGLLNGWTAAGNRPQFKQVTGISTGALIAPFAFLGSRYDDHLKEFYTNTMPDEILERRNILAAIFDEALADTTPLKRLTEKFVTQDVLNEIAHEYSRGRLLYIITTNLDAHEQVVWNMTKIAASGSPKALELFRKIMLASAAVPAAFPPVMIDVKVDGNLYQEMHVDGGVMAAVLSYPPSLKLAKDSMEHGIIRERHLYIIYASQNALLDPDGTEVNRQTLSIARRALIAMTQSHGVGDLFKIYATSQRDNIDFNLAYIPRSFVLQRKDYFDTEYMRELFRTGYAQGAKTYQWKKTPPGL